MAGKEKFGKLVLLEEIESTGMGTEYRAAKLGPAGLEKIVTVLRLQPAISTHAEVARALMDQAKLAAQLQNPNVLKIFGIGKVEQSYYISYEHMEGRSLRTILQRCRQEAFPFSVEHALLVVSKVCSVLEYAQGRRAEGGGRYFHGLLTPACILVSYEGEVRVKGFGYWPSRVVETGALGPDDTRYLAPEQAAGSGDYRSDIYSVGAILMETLTGRPAEPGADLASQISAARLASPSGDDDSLPPSLSDVFRKSLDPHPAARYAEAAEMRKAIDTLLFSGDFTPTTFNLAFFMHSLYRDEIERESRALKQEREASYLEYLGEEAPRPTPAPAPPAPAPTATTALRAEAVEARPAVSSRPQVPPASEVAAVPPHAPAPHDGSPGLGAREAAIGFTFHKKGRATNRMPLLVAAATLITGAAGTAWYFLARPLPSPPPPVQAAPPTPSAEALAAQARVKELEEKLAALEAEKAAAEAKAAEEAKKRLEAQAKARGQAVDPAALQKAQEEARQKAKEEQERKQQEELRRIEEERRAEEARLAEESRRAEEQARAAQLAAAAPAATPPAPAAAATPTPLDETPPPTPVALRPGTLVNINDPGVIPPALQRSPNLIYPPIALRQRVEGVVELNVLVDEKGSVTDAQVVSGVESKAGLNEAAIENVKKRRYRPAAKDGVPVKVWVSVRVVFELPR